MEQKLMFVSDIHGSRYYCEKALARYRAEGADKLILLGDLLYHGARNDLPRDYDTRGTATLLNAVKSEILSRPGGNCDSEVDQMVLEFPVRAEALLLYLKGRLVFVTHGHLYNIEAPPMLKKETFSSTATPMCRRRKSRKITPTSTPARSPSQKGAMCKAT